MSRSKLLAGVLGVLITLLFCSCMGRGKVEEGSKQGEGSLATKEVPTYKRETIPIQMAEGYVPSYSGSTVDYSAEGIFYCVIAGDDYQDYSFYFQPYVSEGKDARLFEKKGGYLRDVSAVKRADGMHYCLLWVDEKTAYISDYDARGKLSAEHVLEGQEFEKAGNWPVLYALSEGGFLVGMNDKAYHVKADGGMAKSITIQDGVVRNFAVLEEGRMFAVYEKTCNNAVETYICELDMEKGVIKEQKGGNCERKLPVEDIRISVFDGTHLAFSDSDYAYLIDMDETKDEKLIDLKRQSILGSQIEGIFGTREELLVVAVDPTERENGTRVFRLMPKAEGDSSEDSMESTDDGKTGSGEKPKYTEDGRRIVRVAISNDEYWPWEIVYRAQKYSQNSDIAYVEVEMFDGPLENYLGRGERPDIVLLSDQSEIAPLVELDALADLTPLYEKQDRYSIDDMLPSAKGALSVGDGFYAIANKFQLLCCTSDGTDQDARGSLLEYLKWYGTYLEEKEVAGLPDLSNFFFAALPKFYDEGEGKAYFDSVEFRELMMVYKELKTKHAAEYVAFDGKFDIDLRVVNRIAQGPKWIGMMLTETQLTKPGVSLTGVPTRDGEQVVYIKLYQPLAILNTSDCKEEALDFILYAKRTKTHVGRSAGGDFHETSDEKQGNTNGYFWVLDEYLKEDIWETEKYCWVIQYEKPIDGWTAGLFDISEEHKEMLRGLMDSAVGVTKVQNDIYGMFLEEMDGYINGNKDLDSCIDILQNRASLYLKE